MNQTALWLGIGYGSLRRRARRAPARRALDAPAPGEDTVDVERLERSERTWLWFVVVGLFAFLAVTILDVPWRAEAQAEPARSCKVTAKQFAWHVQARRAVSDGPADRVRAHEHRRQPRLRRSTGPTAHSCSRRRSSRMPSSRSATRSTPRATTPCAASSTAAWPTTRWSTASPSGGARERRRSRLRRRRDLRTRRGGRRSAARPRPSSSCARCWRRPRSSSSPACSAARCARARRASTRSRRRPGTRS